MKAHQEDIKINIKVVWAWQENRSHPSKGLATYTTCQGTPWVLSKPPRSLKFRTPNRNITIRETDNKLRDRREKKKVLDVVLHCWPVWGPAWEPSHLSGLRMVEEKVFIFISHLWNLHHPSFSRFPPDISDVRVCIVFLNHQPNAPFRLQRWMKIGRPHQMSSVPLSQISRCLYSFVLPSW